ncbi:MAG: DUF819 family protein [Bacteroidetes bacterium]|nr:DUF819 family protein [Bacteroidota bacterium]
MKLGLIAVTAIIKEPLIMDDAIVFGLLMSCLGIVFYTSQLKSLAWFYKIIPALLMCYLLPALLSTFNIISPKFSGLWPIAKNYFLPASLILMTLSTDLKGIIRLGPKALIMFFTATIGIVLGGPIAILITSVISPDTLGGAGPDAVWRGLATLAGSWIGGGANQTAMLELYQFNVDKYGAMLAVDVVVANIWMAFILFGAGKSDKIDRWLRADASSIESLKTNMANYTASVQRNSTLTDLMKIFAIAFGGVGLAHLLANFFGDWAENTGMADSILASQFFWIVVIATTFGLTLSFTKMRRLEGAGASKMGSVFIYILVAIIGMKIDLSQLVQYWDFIIIGLIWMAFHVGLLFLVAKLIKAPFFFLAVGSKANVGGAASAPVVASAFHPSLAPVGVLLAVLGYALGTYGAIFCATLMEFVSP